MSKDIEFVLGLTQRTAKEILSGLESYLRVEKLDPEIRKIVLDACANLRRDQEKLLIK